MVRTVSTRNLSSALSMRVNLPVTNNEYDFPADELLMSTTDAKGVLTH